MKYLPHLLLFFFFSCQEDIPPQIFHSKTLDAVPESPTRDLDRRIRLSPAGALEIKGPSGWEVVSSPTLPQEVLWPHLDKPSPAPLQGFAEGPGLYLGVHTPREVFLSADRGVTWTRILTRDTLGGGAYITALAINPLDASHILIGTSFNGLFETLNQGKTWTKMSALYQSQSLGADYWEQVHSLAFSPGRPLQVYISLGIQGDIHLMDLKTKKMTLLTTLPGGELAQTVHPLAAGEGLEDLEVRSAGAYWFFAGASGEWTKLGSRPRPQTWDEAKSDRMKKAAGRYGHYVSGNQAASAKLLEDHLAFMKNRGLNSLVVDFKDDTGLVIYDSQVEMARKIDAVRRRLDVPALVEKIHGAGHYLIARVVVFKDEKLYRYSGNKYALWDRTTQKPWGYFREKTDETTGEKTYEQKEFWVDVYSQDVWDYNIAVAKELQGLGVDEIQFDYIRFPSDGPTGRISHRFSVPVMTKAGALESFLKKARSEIALPISVDIFGFNGFFPMDYLGQNSPMISKYVDAISPMLYPNHFSPDFFGRDEYLTRAQRIYREGVLRNRLMTDDNVHIRPWIQSFLLGEERKFEAPTYQTLLRNQLVGTREGGGDGWLLWNAANNYYMVREDLTQYR